jgi:hypothetical protein
MSCFFPRQSVDRKGAFWISVCWYVSNDKQKKSFWFSSDTINQTHTHICYSCFACVHHWINIILSLHNFCSSLQCVLKRWLIYEIIFFLDIKILYLWVWMDECGYKTNQLTTLSRYKIIASDRHLVHWFNRFSLWISHGIIRNI